MRNIKSQTVAKMLLVMKNWYVLHTQVDKEQSATIILEQRGFETYCPTVTSKIVHNQSPQQPFFPCYIFLHADSEELDQIPWRWVSGVKEVVACNGIPVKMPKGSVGFIRERLQTYKLFSSTPLSVQQSPKPRTNNGPFKGLHILFDNSCDPSARVSVLFSFLSQSNKVSLSANLSERAPLSSQTGEQKRRRRTRGNGRRIKYKDVVSN